MKDDWLDYPLSMFKSGIARAAGSVFLAALAVSFGTVAAFNQSAHSGDAVILVFFGGGLLVSSIIFPFCWPFLVGFFIGVFRLMRFEGHPFWMFWLMTTCQFFIAVIESWRWGDSTITWEGFGVGLLILGVPFLITLGLFYALERRRRRLDESADA